MLVRTISHVSRAWAALVLFFLATFAHATIIDIGGTGDTGQVITPDEAVAISFTLTGTLSNVSIGAPVACFGCTGGVWLHSNVLGSGASIGDSIGAEAFNSTSVSPFFSGLTLNAGTYFLIVSIDSGFAAWEGSLLPQVVLDSAAQLGIEFEASSLQPFVPFSDFTALFADGSLHYTVTADAVGLDESGTLWLLLSGLVGWLVMARPARRISFA